MLGSLKLKDSSIVQTAQPKFKLRDVEQGTNLTARRAALGDFRVHFVEVSPDAAAVQVRLRQPAVAEQKRPHLLALPTVLQAGGRLERGDAAALRDRRRQHA